MKVFLSSLPPTFTTQEAQALGVHPRDLYLWRDKGIILELSRGVFRQSDAPPASYPDYLAVALRSPQAIVCCISAAAVHELTDEIPESVHIAVPKRSHSPIISFPPVTVFRFEEATFELGLSSIDAGPGEPVRIYDAARTVVDLMRFRKRFGEPIAYLALHRYLDTQGAQPKLLLDYAEALGTFGPMRSALDIASVR